MSRSSLDVIVLASAFLLGMFYSLTHNPITGLSLLIGIVALWSTVSELPRMKRVKIKIEEEVKK